MHFIFKKMHYVKYIILLPQLTSFFFVFIVVLFLIPSLGFLSDTSGKEPACQSRRHETWVWSLGWEDPQEEGMAIHFSILPGESHAESSLVSYSPKGCKELDSIEGISMSVLTSWVRKLQFFILGFPGGAVVKNLPASAREVGLIPGLGRFLGVGNGNLLQYSCLENSIDRRVWWAKVHGAPKSLTFLSTHVLLIWLVLYLLPVFYHFTSPFPSRFY